MKTFFNAAIVLGVGAFAAATSITYGPERSADDLERMSGEYIEARDATVWGGACHISSQAASSGAHLVQAWSFDDGARAVLVTEGEANLDAHRVFHEGEAAPRRALLVADGDVADLRGRLAGLLGPAQGQALDNAAVQSSGIEFRRDGDDFAVVVEGLLDLEGQALADRACCTMPESRWYQPLARVESSVVGHPDVCRVDGDGVTGLEAWTYTGENSVYVGRF